MSLRRASVPRALLRLVVLMVGITALLQQVNACPYANMPGAVPHTRHLMKHGGSGGGGSGGGSGGGGGGVGGPPGICKEYLDKFVKCDSSPTRDGYSTRFYEDKGCTGGPGVWGTVKNALESYSHPQYGGSFVQECLAPLIRNVFHMDVGTGHNGRLLLEDYGSKSNPTSTPNKDPKGSRSAKVADPNQTLRCYDVYEHLRVEVDKYTEEHCHDVYVSCTDLTNYAAMYAHWKLSEHRFLPCFYFGFADDEPEDFAGDAFHNGKTLKEAAETCLPPHDSADMHPTLPLDQALGRDKFNNFFKKAKEAFSKPCYPTTDPLASKDLGNIMTAHTVGESHCFHIQLLVKEPLMNNAFFNKLAADCNKCRAAVEAGTSVNPYSDFKSNLDPKLGFSFAQKCKTAGQQDYLPEGKTTGINRVDTFVPKFGGKADPCCVPNDVFSKDTFDFQYWPQVESGLGLFEVDNGLPVDGETRSLSNRWARCSQTKNMLDKYQEAWNKMNLIGAKPYDGKRRKYCSVPTWATEKA